jgi:hypothetical protein
VGLGTSNRARITGERSGGERQGHGRHCLQPVLGHRSRQRREQAGHYLREPLWQLEPLTVKTASGANRTFRVQGASTTALHADVL